MKLLIPLFLICICSCKSELPQVPADVFSMEQMKTLLVEIHIVDAVAETKAQAGENEKNLSEKYVHQLFLNHKVTKEEFVHSVKFYESHPVLLNMVYDEVLNELSKREETAGKQESNQ